MLKPFEEATKTMSSSEACISSVIPLIHVLTCTLENLLRQNINNTDQTCGNTIQKLIEEITNRFGDLHNNKIYTIATYLDPKYTTKFFNEITKESIESELISLCQDKEGHGAQPQPQTQSFDHDVIQHNQHFHHTDNESLPSTSSGANFSTGRFLQSMLSDMLASAPNSNDEENPIAPIRQISYPEVNNN
ncbi:unnamed protein product [Parnassius apollo]|uniref:(apollo) hypothetical protein n=1 Tax=Parnassius apollo TaxID=110799 RepID=A0A8S3XA97_PARAO|nr:unnamed protein product [Parnassius apollo]